MLSVVSPVLLERAHWLREAADLLDAKLGKSGGSAQEWLRKQADWADDIVVCLGKDINAGNDKRV